MDDRLNYRVVAKHVNGNDVVLQEYDGIVMNDHAMFDIEPGATKEQMHEKFSLLQEERSIKLREQQAQRVKEIGRHNPYINPFAIDLAIEERQMMKHREETEARMRADRVQNIAYVDIPDDNKSTVRAVEGKMSVIPETDLKALKTIAKNEMARNKESVSKTGVDKNVKDVEFDV